MTHPAEGLAAAGSVITAFTLLQGFATVEQFPYQAAKRLCWFGV
jgi:hypothetical protein